MIPHRHRFAPPRPAPWRSFAGRQMPAFAAEPMPASRTAAAMPAEAHPLAEARISEALLARGAQIETAFAAIEPTVRTLAERQLQPGFAAEAAGMIRERLGFDVPADALACDWKAPLDGRRLHAMSVVRTFLALSQKPFDRTLAHVEPEPAAVLIRQWGFHAVDITPCADGRLSGLLDYILRVPPVIVTYRKSYAGSMFDVEESLRQWEEVELRRCRGAVPGASSKATTAYLKIGVYHFSSLDPGHEGCAAHGSNTALAASALLERLTEFRDAVRNTHGPDARVALLLVGVDTDTDGIRVHVPDATGQIDVGRYVASVDAHQATRELDRDRAKDAIRAMVARAAGVAEDDTATEGMRWFCGYLVKNNIAQVDAVLRHHGGAYPDRGHTERLIVVGDSLDDVQLRNLAFQAQMQTVEEGARDLEIGIRILSGLYRPVGLAVPILVHISFDGRIPGAEARAQIRASRMAAAIDARCAAGRPAGTIHVETLVRSRDGATRPRLLPHSALAAVSTPAAATAGEHH